MHVKAGEAAAWDVPRKVPRTKTSLHHCAILGTHCILHRHCNDEMLSIDMAVDGARCLDNQCC